MPKESFAVFILTHGRANDVVTYDLLKRRGYTGKIYLVVDNEDKQLDQYKERYGSQVQIFDKLEAYKKFNNGDNFEDRRCVVLARNACWEIAEKLKVKYFLQLDDDYSHFAFRFNGNNEYGPSSVVNLDRVFESVLAYYKTINCASIAFAQGGDYIGGEDSPNAESPIMLRKAMNTFFLSTDRKFTWLGRLNEDVNTYVEYGSRGLLFLTITAVSVLQKPTQVIAGGMTEAYKDSGTYRKSFYSVMRMPSSVKVAMLQSKFSRIHHQVSWKHTVPQILDEKHKKTG